MAELDHEQVKAAFERVNSILQGKPMPVAVAALQDLLAASVCYAAPDLRTAKSLMKDISRDLLNTVIKNYSHYHATAEHSNREGNA